MSCNKVAFRVLCVCNAVTFASCLFTFQRWRNCEQYNVDHLNEKVAIMETMQYWRRKYYSTTSPELQASQDLTTTK